VSQAEFAKACRSLGISGEVGALLSALRPNGNSASLQLRDIDVDEADNLELFAALLWNRAGCGNLDKAWSLFNPGKRSYVTLSEFVNVGRSLGAQCDLPLVFKGLDAGGNGHLTRDDFEYVKVMAPLFQPMARCAPAISELSAWVYDEFGSIQAFLEHLGLQLNDKEGTLGPCELAEGLQDLGFPGDALEVTRSVTRAGGGPGYLISAEDLVKILIGQKIVRSSSPRPMSPGVRSPSPKLSVEAHEDKSDLLTKEFGWDDTLDNTCRINKERPASQRRYFSMRVPDLVDFPSPRAKSAELAQADKAQAQTRQREVAPVISSKSRGTMSATAGKHKVTNINGVQIPTLQLPSRTLGGDDQTKDIQPRLTWNISNAAAVTAIPAASRLTQTKVANARVRPGELANQ